MSIEHRRTYQPSPARRPQPHLASDAGRARTLALALFGLALLAIVGVGVAGVLGVPVARDLVGRVAPGLVSRTPADDRLAFVPDEPSLVGEIDVRSVLAIPSISKALAASDDGAIAGFKTGGLRPADVESILFAGDVGALAGGDSGAWLAVMRLARDIPAAELLDLVRSQPGAEDTTVGGIAGVSLDVNDGTGPSTFLPLSPRLVAAGRGPWLEHAAAVSGGAPAGGRLPRSLETACNLAERDELAWACFVPAAGDAGKEQAQPDMGQLGALAPPVGMQDIEATILTIGWDDAAGLAVLCALTMGDGEKAAKAETWLQGMLPMASMFLGEAASGLTTSRSDEQLELRLRLGRGEVERLAERATAASTALDASMASIAAPAGPPTQWDLASGDAVAVPLTDGVALDAPNGEPILRIATTDRWKVSDTSRPGWYRLDDTPDSVPAWVRADQVRAEWIVAAPAPAPVAARRSSGTSSGGSGAGDGGMSGGYAAKRTVSDLNTIGTALESRSIDTNDYPRTGGLVPISSIAGQLVPKYIKKVPELDGWNGAVRYWSDGKSWMLVSAGSDGTLDVPESSYTPSTCPSGGQTGRPDADIVMVASELVQW